MGGVEWLGALVLGLSVWVMLMYVVWINIGVEERVKESGFKGVRSEVNLYSWF